MKSMVANSWRECRKKKMKQLKIFARREYRCRPGLSTEAACHFHLGSWQTSNALALQASLCGSVTHRLQPSPATQERAKAVAPKLGTKADFLGEATDGLRLGKPISRE